MNGHFGSIHEIWSTPSKLKPSTVYDVHVYDYISRRFSF